MSEPVSAVESVESPIPKPTAADWDRVHKAFGAKWHELAGALWASGWFDRHKHTKEVSHLQAGFGFGVVPGRKAPLLLVLASLGGFEATLLHRHCPMRRAETADEIVAVLEDFFDGLTDEEKGWFANG
jgi:hypothetical protein